MEEMSAKYAGMGNNLYLTDYEKMEGVVNPLADLQA